MSVYSFIIKKGKYELSLSTTDKELVTEQFELWVRKASDYVQKHKVMQCKEMVNAQINNEKEITQKKIDEQLKRMPKSEPPQEEVAAAKEEFSEADTNKNLDIFHLNGGALAYNEEGAKEILREILRTHFPNVTYKDNDIKAIPMELAKKEGA